MACGPVPVPVEWILVARAAAACRYWVFGNDGKTFVDMSTHLGLGLSCAFIRMHGDFSFLSLCISSSGQVAKPHLQKQGIERADTDLNSSPPMNSKQERGHKWGGGDRIHHRQLSDASSARSVACPWYACFCGLSDGRVLRLSFTSRVRVAFFSLFWSSRRERDSARRGA